MIYPNTKPSSTINNKHICEPLPKSGSRLGQIFSYTAVPHLSFNYLTYDLSEFVYHSSPIDREDEPFFYLSTLNMFGYRFEPLSKEFLLSMDKIQSYFETQVRRAGSLCPLDFALDDFLDLFDDVPVGEGRVAVFRAVKTWYNTVYIRHLHLEKHWRNLYEEETALMSKQQEAIFFENIRSGSCSERWCDVFTHRNGGLVVDVAKSYFDKGLERDVILAAGRKGLNKAVEKFKPELGYKFSTHAWHWIRGEITETFRKADVIERELAKYAGEFIGGAGPRVAEDYKELNNAVQEALDRLNDPRKSKIIIARFGLFGNEEGTLKTIADLLGIKPQRVHTVVKTTLAKLGKDRELHQFYRRWFYL